MEFKLNYQIIFNWHEQDLTCACCKKTQSVKYKHNNGNTYCNACVVSVFNKEK
jgi:hypothetical protein